MADVAVWQLLLEQRLRHRAWDNEFVVFNDATGDIHLLGCDAMAVLQRLAAGPADAAALGSALELADDAGEQAALQQLLHNLRQLALIEPCPQ